MRTRFRSLPLFWKILVPFLTLLLVVGLSGTFLIVRTLSARAQSTLDQDLSRRALEVRSTLRDRELYLLESATLAANLQGMAAAVLRHDAAATTRLARSVLALKTDLELLALIDRRRGIVELRRTSAGLESVEPRAWGAEPVVAQALAEPTALKHAGILESHDPAMLVIAAPVCTETPECRSAGVAIVGVGLDALAGTSVLAAAEGSVAIYGPDGSLLAHQGSLAAPAGGPEPNGRAVVRRLRAVGGEEVASLFAPYEVQGRRAGSIAVSIPSGPAFASAREAAVRLALLLVAAMGGVVALGALVSRLILAQVRPLVEANRALGSGDLSARVPVLAKDELGELARGVNKMAEELQRSYEMLESRVGERTAEVLRLLQERTDFFAAISHELRTPLAVIIAQAEMMRDPTVRRSPGWTAETGNAIGDSATQLLSLVNDILDLARAEAGRLVVSPVEVDLAEVVAGIRPSMEGLTRAGQIEAAVYLGEELRVMADPTRVREILLNLIDNAVKYTPPSGRVEVAATRRTDGMVEVSVLDTGIGIPPEVGDRIFEPFFRVVGSEPQRGQASSGLGLALARRLIEAHGGTISYTSDPKKGTRFVFTLPAVSRLARTRRIVSPAG
jgi:signal transduction histidine kinase